MTYIRSAIILSLAISLLPLAVKSQPVVPAPDGTNTVVNAEQNRWNISGGKLSVNGTNLFHSFSQFNLSEGQIANFLTNPKIQNILGRITGGDVSLINGLISVSGGNSNLFLMNPAGIIFGQNARLNVPGSFLATTATGIGFGESWFNSTGINDYQSLVGNPTQFNFNNSQIGAIVNAGNLVVGNGQSLTLLGGTVINTGQLSAPGGQITVAAVPGSNAVRISQAGNLLSLEITPALQSENNPIAPVALPQLLTGPGVMSATGLTTNAKGELVLTGGTTVGVNGASTIVSGSVNVFAPAGTRGGSVNILGEKVGLFGATINASGIEGGGVVRVGGGFQGQAPIPNALVTYVSPDSTLELNAIDRGNGGLAVIWADNITRFFGNITARGGNLGGNGGEVEVSGKSSLIFQGQVDTRAPNGAIGTSRLDPANITIVNGKGETSAPSMGGELDTATESSSTTISEVQLEQMSAGSNVVLEATNNIILQDLADNRLGLQARTGDSVTFNAGGVFFVNDPKDSIETQGGNINIFASSISVGGLNAKGGNIALTASGIDLRGDRGSVSSAGGTIRLQPDDDRAIRIGGTGDILGILDLTAGDIGALAGDFRSIAIGRENTSSIAIVGPTTILSPLTLQGISIDIQNPLTAIGGASLTFQGAQTAIGGNIATSGGDITFNSPVTLSRNATIATTAGNITFAQSLDSAMDTAPNLALLAGGNVTFGSAIGQTQSLGLLRADAAAVTGNGTITTGNFQVNARNSATLRGSTTATSGADIKGENVLLEGNLRTDGGAVNLLATGEVRTANILSKGGNIGVEGNSLTVGAIDSAVSGGTGGAIVLKSNAGALTAGALNASGAIGGNISLTSTAAISAFDVSAAGSVGSGGNVSLNAIGNIQLGFINAQSGNAGSGGNVDITTKGLFRSNNVFNDISGNISSISTAGGGNRGAIVIRHSGGSDRPFVIGSDGENGTRGSINAGAENAILPTLSFLETYTQGSFLNQISLITNGASPTPIPIPQPIPVPVEPIPEIITQPVPVVNPAPINPITKPSIPPSLQVELRPPTGKNSPVNSTYSTSSNRSNSAGAGVLAFERTFTREYEKYLDLSPRKPITNMSVIYEILRKNEAITGVRSAIIYMNWVSGDDAKATKENGGVLVASQDLSNLLPVTQKRTPKTGETDGDSDRFLGEPLGERLNPKTKAVADLPKGEILELVLVTANAQPQRFLIPKATRWQILQLADSFQTEITNPRRRNSISYLDTAQKLYNWLIAPLASEITGLKIDNLMIIPAAGLRSVPFAALHDGKQFLVEQYSLSVIPSLSLTDIGYDNIADDEILAMGASVFEDKAPLPAVPVELESIVPPDRGQSFLNQDFTLRNLQSQRQNRPFGIIHLATHSEFLPGEPKNSYIQLWDAKLRINQMRQLRWNEPAVNLLVLSACSTALGDEEAELGFAGLAVASGAKSALASLWEVSDDGTLGLMTEFYRQLRLPRSGGNLITKADALRRAQLEMLRGRVRIQDGMLRAIAHNEAIALPPDIAMRGDRLLSHPYFWAAFTLIGNPW